MNAPQPLKEMHPLIAPESLAQARKLAASRAIPLVQALEETVGVPPAQFVSSLGRSLGMPAFDMSSLHALSARFDLLPFPEAAARHCVLFTDHDDHLLLVAGDPFDLGVRSWAEERVRRALRFGFAHPSDVQAYLNRYEEDARAIDGLLESRDPDAKSSVDVEDLSLVSISADTSPVVRLVHSTLYDALKAGASDIHLESHATGLAIKYRLDGVLANVGNAAGQETAEQVISRIKVMSELDISERRVPQDGRFKVSAKGREIDVRVSIMPNIFGEDAVLRILDKAALTDHVRGLRLDFLGFDERTLVQIRRLSSEPYGMLLVTGPTGSGKTTTLYAAITEINHGRDKIITIEDPVEYQLPGVLQIPVNEKKGLTFARGLRSILRHDPDKIMVGEIRDADTAQIAVQAALTGHLVFTTVHANNVLDVMGRFSHMGLDLHSFVSALNGVVAQRLVRITCPDCSEVKIPDQAELEVSGLSRAAAEGFSFRAGRGCGQCRGTGYRGRKAVSEIVAMNDELRELIAAREAVRHVKEALKRQGMRTLRDSALDLVRQGETTLAEINRVTLVG